MAWVMSMRSRRPDIIIVENVVGMNLGMITASFGDIYDVDLCIDDPNIQAGIPFGRPRIFGVLVNRATMCWTQTLKLSALLSRLACRCTTMTGGTLFTDPDPDSFKAMTEAEA